MATICPVCRNGALQPQWREPPEWVTDEACDAQCAAIDAGEVPPDFYECDCSWCGAQVED